MSEHDPKPAFIRRGAVAMIDPIDMRLAVDAGFSSGEIAAMFHISAPTVLVFCRQEGIPLPARPKGGRRKADAPAPCMPARDKPAKPPVDERTASLIDTGGRYADLRAWALRWGTTETKARQEWHKLGLPISRVASI